MASLNKVQLIGHLGRDAETRFTASGTACTNFSLATSRRWKDKSTDEWKEETDWHNIVLWRSENLAQYLTKGKQVYVEGRLQTRKWEDKEGQTRYTTEVVVENILLLGGKGDQAKDESGVVSKPRSQGSLARASRADAPAPEISDDDVPF